MRISDLIPSRSVLITRDYWNRQNHLIQPIAQRPFAGNRMNPLNGSQENMPGSQQPDTNDNQRFDALGNPRSGSSGGRGFGDQANQDLNSSNQSSPGNQQSTDQRYASGDADFQAVTSIGKNSAEINWEYALIERLDERDLSTRLIPFRLASAIDDPSSADNQLLKPGDVITVFSRADLELPMEKHATFVRVGGEVNAPGIYRVNPGETLRDVVKMAGGLTSIPTFMHRSSREYRPVWLRNRRCVSPPNKCSGSSLPTSQMQRRSKGRRRVTSSLSLRCNKPRWPDYQRSGPLGGLSSA